MPCGQLSRLLLPLLAAGPVCTIGPAAQVDMRYTRSMMTTLGCSFFLGLKEGPVAVELRMPPAAAR
eukprot:3421567-Prymnesium_polylepis.1